MPYKTVPAFSRIVSDPEVLGGKPCIRRTRISVEFILELIASGASPGEIVQTYPHLAGEDVKEAVRYASYFLKNETFLAVEVGSA